MKHQLIGALLAAAVLSSVAVAGCSSDKKNNSETASSQTVTETQTEAPQTAASTTQAETKAPTATLAGLTATKVGSVKVDVEEINFDDYGIVYTGADGKKGAIGFDGKNVTAAQYAEVKPIVSLPFLRVFTAKPAKGNYNTCGLIGVDGKEVLKAEYGYIEPLNERYALVFTVDGETTDTEKIVLSQKASGDEFAYELGKDGSEKSFSGTWAIYDMQSKALVKGLSGTKYDYGYIEANGQFLTVGASVSENRVFDATGSEITDGRKIFADGSYLLEVNDSGAVYSTDGERLFAYNVSDYSITQMAELPDKSPGDYYIAQQGENWIVLNKKGEVVSSPFPEEIENAYPAYVEVWNGSMDYASFGYNLYTLDGSEVVTGGSVTMYDAVNQDAYLFDMKDSYCMLDAGGNILLSKSGDTSLLGNYASEFLFRQSDNFYNFAEGDYSISGNTTYSNWLVMQESGKLCNLVDTRTGKTILEGYLTYKSLVVGDVQYVYAFNNVNGQYNKGDFDIYTVAK